MAFEGRPRHVPVLLSEMLEVLAPAAGGLYLDGGEDPGMAEMLARRSVRLHDRPEAWLLLARALRALDREADARRAEGRALSA